MRVAADQLSSDAEEVPSDESSPPDAEEAFEPSEEEPSSLWALAPEPDSPSGEEDEPATPF